MVVTTPIADSVSFRPNQGANVSGLRARDTKAQTTAMATPAPTWWTSTWVNPRALAQAVVSRTDLDSFGPDAPEWRDLARKALGDCD